MDALGCLLIVIGLCCAGVLLWLLLSGFLFWILDRVLHDPFTVDGAITAALLIGAFVCLPIGIRIIRRGLPP